MVAKCIIAGTKVYMSQDIEAENFTRRDSRGGHARNWIATAGLTIRYLHKGLDSPSWFGAVVGCWTSGPVIYVGRAVLWVRVTNCGQTSDKL